MTLISLVVTLIVIGVLLCPVAALFAVAAHSFACAGPALALDSPSSLLAYSGVLRCELVASEAVGLVLRGYSDGWVFGPTVSSHSFSGTCPAVPDDGLVRALLSDPCILGSEFMPIGAVRFAPIDDSVDWIFESAFGDAVPHVLGMGAEEQVLGVHAFRVVTGMTDADPVRNGGSTVKHEACSVGQHEAAIFSSFVYRPVTTTVYRSNPLPAFVAGPPPNFCPKTDFQWNSLGVHGLNVNHYT